MVDRHFDLITCMLGTLSYFGRDAGENSTDDALQEALCRMETLLSPDGLLLLGTWSDAACAKFDMLQIYSHSDRSLLVKWTPKRSDLKDRLKRAGFAGRPEGIGPALRLDFWICRKGRATAISTLPPGTQLAPPRSDELPPTRQGEEDAVRHQ